MRTKNRAREIVLVGLLAAMIGVCSQIILPIGPVSFNMGVFAVFFAGAMLSPLWAATCVGVYVMLGVIGLPVFAGFNAGPQALVGPTGGYIIGYFALAVCTALGVKYTQAFVLRLLAGLGGLAACYTFGTAWFMVLTGSQLASALLACVVPFIVPDIAKGLLAFALAKAVQARMQRGRTA